MSGICRDANMPDRRTVLRWLVADTEFCRMYARARELGADVIAETAVAEAVAPMRPEDVQHARLAFDAQKWWVAKLAPRKYSRWFIHVGSPVYVAAPNMPRASAGML
jgi:hypothetical protein